MGRIREEHDHAINIEGNTGPIRGVQTQNDFLTIAHVRLNSEVDSLKADLTTNQASFDRVYSELKETKNRLLRAEVDLGDKEQRLEVLQIERDELAKKYYGFDTAEDPFFGSYTTGESEIDESELDSIDSRDNGWIHGQEKDKGKLPHPYHHHEKRSPTMHRPSMTSEAVRRVEAKRPSMAHHTLPSKEHAEDRKQKATASPSPSPESAPRPKHTREKKLPHYMLSIHHTKGKEK